MLRILLVSGVLATGSVLGEERTYSLTLDGRPAGEILITLRKDSTGTTAINIRADSSPFAYEYRGTEDWKENRLVRLEGSGSDNGRRGGISIVGGKDGYNLKAGAKDVRIRDEVWPTTGVTLPDLDRSPLVVDALTGDVLRAKVEKVGPDRIVVAGKPLPVTRYQITAGGQRWDLWYDADQRLAKRVWTRDGRTLVALLTNIKRD